MGALKEGTYLVEHLEKPAIMKISQQNGQLMYQIDGEHSMPVSLVERNNYIKIIKQIDPETALINPKLHLTFKTIDGLKFTYSSTSTTNFRRILDFFPTLLKRLKISESNKPINRVHNKDQYYK